MIGLSYYPKDGSEFGNSSGSFVSGKLVGFCRLIDLIVLSFSLAWEVVLFWMMTMMMFSSLFRSFRWDFSEINNNNDNNNNNIIIIIIGIAINFISPVAKLLFVLRYCVFLKTILSRVQCAHQKIPYHNREQVRSFQRVRHPLIAIIVSIDWLELLVLVTSQNFFVKYDVTVVNRSLLNSFLLYLGRIVHETV